MNKRSFLPLLVVMVALFAVLRLWQNWRFDQAGNALNDVIRSTELDDLLSASSEEFHESVDQAMRGLTLTQGEKGHETWELKAVWGTLREESGVVDLQEPTIRYAMGEPENAEQPSYARARADQGRVEDNNRLMTMNGNVLATWQDQSLSGPVGHFRSDSRVLTMPEGGDFSGKDIVGHGNVLRWDFKANIMEAEHGVKLVWTPTGASGETHF